jgi:acetyl esterase/lipase
MLLKYGQEDRHLIKLDLPSEPTTKPILIYIHGGAWISGSINDTSFEKLVKLGYPVAQIEYRLSKVSNIQHPTHTFDVSEGLKFLFCETKKLNLPDKAVLIGHSCGAHISGLILFQSGWIDENVKNWIIGYIGIQGIYSLDALLKSHPTYDSWFLSYAFPDKNWDQLDLYNNLSYFSVKALVIYSLEDELVNFNHSEMFYQALLGVGIDSEICKDISDSHDGILKNDLLFEKIHRFLCTF